ncbi:MULTISPECIES: response regulator transcription factor [unclassified Clostridium]|uniref:response regulator transcription factor n=1 Tax=unclassified Clostridium TaxID=2614128 RepID=UPI001FAE4A71
MNILLVDDHKLFAKSLEVSFQQYDDIKHFDVLEDIEAIYERAKKYDLILMDINLKGISEKTGLDISEGLLQKNKNIKIIILTGFDLPVYEYEAHKMGASGFVNKNIEIHQLYKIMKEVINDKKYFVSNNFLDKLTETEKKVLRYLSQGSTRDKIAEELYISKRTLGNHLQNIYDKLQVNSAVAAIVKGIELGYITK